MLSHLLSTRLGNNSEFRQWYSNACVFDTEFEFDCRSLGKETEMDYNKICNVRFISMKSEANILFNVYRS